MVNVLKYATEWIDEWKAGGRPSMGLDFKRQCVKISLAGRGRSGETMVV